MSTRRVGALSGVLVGGLAMLVACTSERSGQTFPALRTEPVGTPPSSATTDPATTSATSTVPATTSTSATSVPRRTTTTSGPRRTTTTDPPRTTTTTSGPVRGVDNPDCVVRIQPGDSLSGIADRVDDETVTVRSLQRENGIRNPDAIEAGDLLDICVRNDRDDITGERRVTRPPRPRPGRAAGATRGTGVAAQQEQLNALFAGSGLPPLAVDGDSGPLTTQQLCAARVALGLPISRADVAPGSAEERRLMAARSLSIPSSAPSGSARWALIDVTCQVMFVGEAADRIAYVFQTSTGEPGYETPAQNDSRVFRFDPARENGGWHDSVDFPATIDNPLNGNMYMPLYFDGGRAIHGANYVPTDPQSKGCARLQVANQDALVNWLGLRDEPAPMWDSGRIDLTVSVQGRY